MPILRKFTFRLTLCSELQANFEVFDCNNQQLEASGILDKFHAWLKEHPELKVGSETYCGEMVNDDIADQFYEFYKNMAN